MPSESVPSDYDDWCQCHSCGAIYPI